jgi:CRISPR-associated protein Csm4
VLVHQSSFQKLISGDCAMRLELHDNPTEFSGRIHTAIDRDLGSAAEGQLFEVATEHLDKSFDTLSVFIRSDRYLEELIFCFRALSFTGFGKKSSTGLGAFDVVEKPQLCEWLDRVADANAFVTLSHFVPAPTDPTKGRWRLHVTYPKFHANAVSNVFKGSILMLAPGSVFRTGAAPQPWYGSMISVARPEIPRAVHYALAFAAPLRWPEELA